MTIPIGRRFSVRLTAVDTNPLQSQSTNEIIENILKRAAIELGIKAEDSNEGSLGMARSGTTLTTAVISNTSGITANILFQPGEL